MNIELAWLTLPLVGLLSQIGGIKYKLFRRLGVPLVIAGVFFLLSGFSWRLPVLFIFMCLATRLPFTCIGDKLSSHWFNWAWIWIAGYLLGLPSILLSWRGALYALVPCVVQGLFGTLSNIRATAKYFPWKLCEALFYMAMAYPYILIMTNRSN